MMSKEIMEFEARVEVKIKKYIKILERFPEEKISAEEYMKLYTYIYDIFSSRYPHDYAPELYNLYGQSIKEYLEGTVLPSLREKQDKFLLLELLNRWNYHKFMVNEMSGLFWYLDRYFTERRSLPSLKEVGLTCFYNAVHQDINIKARDIIISLIKQEREGVQIDRVLLKNFLDYFVEVGGLDYNQKHFEEAMLDSTASYYLRKALSWITENYDDQCFIEKGKDCLRREEENVSHYLAFSSKDKLLTTVQQQLLSVYQIQQLEKAKVEDLSRILSASCMIQEHH